jgi:hypothetical protein
VLEVAPTIVVQEVAPVEVHLCQELVLFTVVEKLEFFPDIRTLFVKVSPTIRDVEFVGLVVAVTKGTPACPPAVKLTFDLLELDASQLLVLSPIELTALK